MATLPHKSATHISRWPVLDTKTDSRELTGGAVFGVRLATLKAGMTGVAGLKHFPQHWSVSRVVAEPGLFSEGVYARYTYTLMVSPELSSLIGAVMRGRVAPRYYR